MWAKIALFGTLPLALWWHMSKLKLSWPWTWLGIPGVVTVCYLVTGGWRFARVVEKTALRDARALYVLLRIRHILKRDTKCGHPISFIFERTAQLTPDKIALQHVGGRAWTFRDVSTYAQSVAVTFHSRGYEAGDIVALLMESRPEFICIWLGLSRLGVRVAFINTNLRQDALLHCIRISKSRAIIIDKELTSTIDEVREHIATDVELFCQGDHDSSASFLCDLEHDMANTFGPVPPHVSVTGQDVCLYIYTSGTTGLPKAAAITHSRFNYLSVATYLFAGIRRDDVVYCCLPLYHSLGGLVGVGLTLVHGSTMVIRPKFSASQFWDDCTRYNCTVMLYIGELCRYLLAQPVSKYEHANPVRLAYGNGLRAEIWMAFKTRFNIEKIVEFYGSTEGNVNVVNTTGKVGAVGFNSRIFPNIVPIGLIRVDEVSGQPLRDKHGLGVRCNPGEPGELVGTITVDPTRAFKGYLNENTDSKIAHNIFKKGDKVFLSGDILVMDELGYLYFKDRTGDTFRWRGENVSTLQVEATISNLIQLKDVVVYGVEVPNNDGCTGMAVIVDSGNDLHLDQLHTQLQQALPSFAIPVFLRLVKNVQTTGTHKFQKEAYKKEGFNPSVISDRLYYHNAKLRQYLPFDDHVYNDICSGVIRI